MQDVSSEVTDVAFVDDEAIVVFSKDAVRILENIKVVVSTVVKVFAKHAMAVNFDKGKTEVVVKLRGKNLVKAKSSLASNIDADGTSRIPIVL